VSEFDDIRSRNPSGKCKLCATWVPSLRRDHIVPLKEGGLHDLENIQWLCPPCNDQKTAEDNRRMQTGVQLSDEHKAAISAAVRRPEVREKISSFWTPERREQHRQTMLRRSPNERGH
jgi:5-methylcytosine-specific restriction endonuclease McrA